MPAALSLNQARRIALAAQGLAKRRPTGPVSARAVGRTFAQLQLVQIDSVNVLSRSHFLPFYSRLGNYDRAILGRLAGSAPRRMMEYWAHEASFIRPEHYHDLLLWQRRAWVGANGLDPAMVGSVSAQVLAALANGPPMTAADVSAKIGHVEAKSNQNWGWNWNTVKRVLEHLFEAGQVSAAARTDQFERKYTLTERVLPASVRPVVSAPLDLAAEPDRDAALLRLTEAAAQAHGIGSAKCFADYFRTPIKSTSLALRELVAQGRVEAVSVAGWDREVFRHVDAVLPRKAAGAALLSPFDSMVFERRRLEELFGFHYRIEIYTPAHKRRFGYYVLPFLLRDQMVARVDLKADRPGRKLLVKSAFAEPGAPADTAIELAAELSLMAQWLDLDDVVVHPVGDLASELAAVMPLVVSRDQ